MTGPAVRRATVCEPYNLPIPATVVDCMNPEHDHYTTDYDGCDPSPTPKPMVCADCGVPTHYDYGVEDYRHDDPDAADCYLIRKRTDET